MVNNSPSINNLSQFQVIRLNQVISPVDEFEMDLYRKLGIQPFQVETHSTEELIQLVQTCDAVLVVSAALPGIVIEQMRNCRVICRLGIGVDKIDVESSHPVWHCGHQCARLLFRGDGRARHGDDSGAGAQTAANGPGYP